MSTKIRSVRTCFISLLTALVRLSRRDERFSLLFSALLLLPLAGCQLVVSPGEQGVVTSESGSADCSTSSCAFDVDVGFSEQFTAVPKAGYVFKRWEGWTGCGEDPVCTVNLAAFPALFIAVDNTLNLKAVFLSEQACSDTTDTDGDGLDDCTEINESLTLPNVADTDGDGRNDGYEWTLFDPDNDVFIFNPRISDLPAVSIDLVQLPKVEIDYTVNGSQTTTIGTEFGNSNSNSISTEQGGSISRQVAFSHSVNASIMVGAEASPTDPKLKTELTIGFEATQSHSRGSAVNWSNSEIATREQSYNESESASKTQGFSYSGGRLSAVVEIRNSGDVSYQISDLFLTAQLVDPFRPLAVETIGTMQFDGGQPLVAQVQSSNQKVGPYSFKISDLTLDYAKALMRDRRDIVVNVGSYILKDINGTSTLLREDDVAALTATILIDYGSGSASDQYRVAVRQPNGDKFITAYSALQDILKLNIIQGTGTWNYPGGSAETPFGLKGIGGYLLSAGSNRYWQIAHNHNNENGTLARSTDTYNIVLDEFDLQNIILRAGDKLLLTYVGDADRDGIPDRAEENYGTDPDDEDSDGDGLTDGQEVFGWLTNLGSPPCNSGDLVQVYSDPLSSDSDNDGTPDNVEYDNCDNPSADFVADAGTDQDVNMGSTVNLSGSFTGNASDTPLYTWRVVEGPLVFSNGAFTNTLEGQTPSFTAPSDVLTMIFELTVQIGDLKQTDEVVVNVFENLATAIFVGQINQDEIEIGTQLNPYGSLEDAHRDHPNDDLYVMTQESLYELESRLVMGSGVSIYGGYNSDWVRNVSSNKTGVLLNIRSNRQAAVYYDDISDDTTVSGLAFSGINYTDDPAASMVAILVDPAATGAGKLRILHNDVEVPSVYPNATSDTPGSSYGIYVANVLNLEVEGNTLVVGNGGYGAVGDKGADIPDAGGGYTGGNGGDGSSGLGSGTAGKVGGNNKSGSCSNGGSAGKLTWSDTFIPYPILTSPGSGYTGCSGSTGSNAVGVSGMDWFTDASLGYVASVGDTGNVGENGSGGGGGGGGSADLASSGGDGGKGGTGGVGGNGGLGGIGGGASVGIWLYQVDNAQVADNNITTGNGGNGARGGYGGGGATGTNGAGGGAKSGNAFKGGNGGKGGTGGTGGRGGAGNGGPSYAICIDEIVASMSVDDNYLSTGNGGTGGYGPTASNAGSGGDSFGVYLLYEVNGVPDMENNHYNIGSAGSGGQTGTASGLSGENSWD